MYAKSIFVLPLAVLSVAAIACSSSESGGSTQPGSVTSLDSGKQVQQLSDGEKDQYCKDIAAYTSASFSATEAKQLACTLAGTLSAALSGAKTNTDARAKCKTAYDDCMAKPAQQSSGTNTTCAVKAQASTCNGLTVGEYNACVSSNVTAQKEMAAKGCEALDVETPKTQTTLSPACTVVKDKCPALSGG
jgi:hypothetical protein